MRELIADLEEMFLDLRGLRSSDAELYHPNDYSASQGFAAARRWPFASPGEAGFVYDSVRNSGGTNVCVFRPTVLALPLIQGDHVEYVWDRDGEPADLKHHNVARPHTSNSTPQTEIGRAQSRDRESPAL